MSTESDPCFEALNFHVLALECGDLPPDERRHLARHLLDCIDCQISLASSVIRWEGERTIPQAPQSIERWRAVAHHLWSTGQRENDAADAADIASLDERVFWWREQLAQLEHLAAQTAWSLDADQEDRVYRWLTELEGIARACGGILPRRKRRRLARSN